MQDAFGAHETEWGADTWRLTDNKLLGWLVAAMAVIVVTALVVVPMLQ